MQLLCVVLTPPLPQFMPLSITEMSEQFARYLIEGKAAVRLIKVSINKQFDVESEINK